jgi:hypothetical protein
MVRMGSLNWQSDKTEINQVEMTTNQKYVHPQYNPETLLHNIALIHLLEDAPQNGKFLNHNPQKYSRIMLFQIS